LTIFAFIKNVGIVIVSVFLYLKILNMKQLPNAKLILIGIFTLFLSLLSHAAWTVSQYLYIVTVAACLAIFFKFAFRIGWGLAVTVAVLAYTMSYALYIMAAWIVAVPLAVLAVIHGNAGSSGDPFWDSFLDGSNYENTFWGYILYNPGYEDTVWAFLAYFVIQFSLAIFIFRIKRLRSGFPILKKDEFTYFAFLFGFFGLLFATVFNRTFDIRQLIFLSMLGMSVLAVGIFLWWRASITRAYKDMLKDRQIDEENKKTAIMEQEMETQKEHIQFLSSIIHKDNKLIPAMSLAVENFIRLSENQLDEDAKRKAQMILDEMDSQSRERAGYLSEYKTVGKKIPKTNLFKIDSMFEYLGRKALQNGAIFDLAILCDVRFLIGKSLTEADLVTLMADLIDNAIYAVSSSPFKRILTTICIEDGCYEVRVSDSGADFNIDTLHKLGKASATTHEDDGGSGIGYLTIFKILNETKASLVIQEYEHKPNALTKQIAVRFDGKNRYAIESPRINQIVVKP